MAGTVDPNYDRSTAQACANIVKGEIARLEHRLIELRNAPVTNGHIALDDPALTHVRFTVGEVSDMTRHTLSAIHRIEARILAEVINESGDEGAIVGAMQAENLALTYLRKNFPAQWKEMEGQATPVEILVAIAQDAVEKLKDVMSPEERAKRNRQDGAARARMAREEKRASADA